MRNDDSDKASFTHSTMPGELRRVEVITGTARRRTWSAHEKARIVAESFEPGANVSEVARRHGVNRGQLFTWRRQAMRSGSVDAGANAPTFVPVSMAPSEVPGVEQSSSTRDRDGQRPHPGSRRREWSGVTSRFCWRCGACGDWRPGWGFGSPGRRRSRSTFGAAWILSRCRRSEALRDDPFCGALFVFRSKRSGSNQNPGLGRNRPVSVFEAFGKRALYMAARSATDLITLSAAQLSSLIDGSDWRRSSAHVVKRPSRAG